MLPVDGRVRSRAFREEHIVRDDNGSGVESVDGKARSTERKDPSRDRAERSRHLSSSPARDSLRLAEPEVHEICEAGPIHSLAGIVLFFSMEFQCDDPSSGFAGGFSKPKRGVAVRRADLQNDFRFCFLDEQVHQLAGCGAHSEQKLVSLSDKVVPLQLVPPLFFRGRSGFILVENPPHRADPLKPFVLLEG